MGLAWGAWLVVLPLAASFGTLPPLVVTGATSRIGVGARVQQAPCVPTRHASRRALVAPRGLCALRAAEREFPAVPVPPSQVARAIVPGQRRELHVYDPANVAAVRRARCGLRLTRVCKCPSTAPSLALTVFAFLQRRLWTALACGHGARGARPQGALGLPARLLYVPGVCPRAYYRERERESACVYRRLTCAPTICARSLPSANTARCCGS
jgi:hypothetical protein